MTYAYGGRNYFDTYSHKSGKLIARRSFSDSDEDAGLLIPRRTHHALPTIRLSAAAAITQ